MTRTAVIILACLACAPGCKREKAKNHADPSGPITIEKKEIFPVLDAGKIEKLTIERTGHDTVVLERAADGWHLRKPIDDRADPRALQFALDELRKIEWGDKPVATEKTEWPVYQAADNEVATLRIVHDGAEMPALHLAKKRYARVGASPELYRIIHISHYTFAREVRMWRDRHVLQFDAGEVTGIAVTDAKGRRVTVAREAGAKPPIHEKAAPGDAWKATGGAKLVSPLDENVPDTLFRKLRTLEARDIADNVTRAQAGLDKPRATLAVLTSSGEQILEVGAENAEHVYLGRTGSDRVWVIPKHAAAVYLAPFESWKRKK